MVKDSQYRARVHGHILCGRLSAQGFTQPKTIRGILKHTGRKGSMRAPVHNQSFKPDPYHFRGVVKKHPERDKKSQRVTRQATIGKIKTTYEQQHPLFMHAQRSEEMYRENCKIRVNDVVEVFLYPRYSGKLAFYRQEKEVLDQVWQ